MSILAKKMSTVSSVPVTYAALGEKMCGVHDVLLENVQPFLQSPFKAVLPLVAAGQYKVILKAANEAEPCFVIGTEDQPQLAIIQISQELAQSISERKLGAKVEKGKNPKPLGLLDLVLLRPVVDKALLAFKELLGEGSSSLRVTHRCVGLSNVKGVDEGEKWVQLNLPFGPVDGPAKKTKTPLSVTFLLSALMADTMSMALQSGSDAITIDPDDPWATHMHGMVLQSSLSLKVIVEVLNMSVADCTRLELGQTLVLPGASHRHLSVSTETKSGLVSLATSTLGMAKSNKAVKLLDDIDPGFLSDFDTLLHA